MRNREIWLRELRTNIDDAILLLSHVEALDTRNPAASFSECRKALNRAREWAEELE